MPILDEIEEDAEQERIEQEYQQELERQQQLERKRREQEEKKRRIEQINKQIAEQVEKYGARAGTSAAEAGAAEVGAAAAGEAAVAGGAAAGAGTAAGASGAAAAAGGGAAATAPAWGVALVVVLIVVVILVVIFGTLYAICNPSGWVSRGLSIAAKATILPDGVCEALNSSSLGNGIGSVTAAMCRAPADLAAQNNTPYPAQSDPQLDQLIACVRSRVNLNGVAIATYDMSHPICNYTRGQPICDACSHGPGCHYGGIGGNTGALAVDFAAVGARGVEVLRAAIACGIPLKRSTCENSSGGGVLCSDPSATHVHTSIATCDQDNGPINTQ